MGFLSDTLLGIETVDEIVLADPKQTVLNASHAMPLHLEADTTVPFKQFQAELKKANVNKEDGEEPADWATHIKICEESFDPIERAIHFALAKFGGVDGKYYLLWQLAEQVE